MNKYIITFKSDSGEEFKVEYYANSIEEAKEKCRLDFSNKLEPACIEIYKKIKISHNELLDEYNDYFLKQKKERQEKYGFKDKYLESIKEKYKNG